MEPENKPIKANKLVSSAIQNPHFIIVICLLLIIFGVMAIYKLPKDLLPAGNQPAVQILSFYAGMPVENVEKNLTARFERYTGQAIGVNHQESESLVGVSIVKNFFGSNSDLNSAVSQTTALVMSMLGHLPPGTQPPLILPFDPMAAIPLALVAVDSDNSIEKTYDVARYQVRNAVQAVPGAMAPTVMGGTQREVIIYLDPKKLREYNFSPLGVLEPFSKLSTFIPSGDVKIGNFDYQIISNGEIDKISDMNNFPLRAEYGVPVYLKDVGHAEDSGQIQTNIVMIDGKERVYVPIYRQPGGNSLSVVDETKVAIAKLQDRLHGVKLTLVADQSIFIRHAISSITEEALIGGALAALMIFLFLGNPRASLGILLSLPLSIIIALIGLKVAGQTINAMTLGGLALSIGVLLDNSIVVLENINKKIESGRSLKEAALEGASEVSMPVLASTLATLVVFFPVVFLTGIVNILFFALALAVIFAMVGSYLVGMTVMPLFASYCLQAKHGMHPFFVWTHHVIHLLTVLYGKLLLKCLYYRKIVLTSAILLFVTAMLLAPKIGTELFPRADAGNFILQLRLNSGTRIEKTAEFANVIDKKLREWILPKDLSMIISNAGVSYGYPAAFTPNTGTQDVFFNVELKHDRVHTTQYYAKKIREHMKKEFPKVEIGFQLGGLLTSAINEGAKTPINVQIEGPDLKECYKLAQHIFPEIQKLKGAVDVRIQERFDSPTLNVAVNRQVAMTLGVTTDDVIKNVVSAVTGSTTFDSKSIWIDPKTGIDYPMGVQFAEEHISSFDQFSEIPIQGQGKNRTVPLNRIATIGEKKTPTEINHVNYQPVIDIYLDAQDRDIGGLSNDVYKILKNTPMPKSYSATIRGEIATMKSAVGLMGGGFVLAAVLVYLILVIQFRSFLLPSIILMSVPLGLIGIVFMFLLTNTYFSIQAAIGAIFMVGISVANGVLLIEFISHHIRLNTHFETGIVAGAQARLRPIIMTSLSAILGLIPMAIGIGHGAEANIPLGRAVIGGQFVSTLLTLFVVPTLYCFLGRNLHQKMDVPE